MFEFFTFDVFAAFLQVVLIDLVLAGDNAVVIGLAAAGLPEGQRGKAILIGIGAATVLRVHCEEPGDARRLGEPQTAPAGKA